MDQHPGGINSVRYAPTGTLFASAGEDGVIKVFDAVNGKCVKTWTHAHGGVGLI